MGINAKQLAVKQQRIIAAKACAKYAKKTKGIINDETLMVLGYMADNLALKDVKQALQIIKEHEAEREELIQNKKK